MIKMIQRRLDAILHWNISFVGGFLGGYAILSHAGVFGSAQTGNLMEMASNVRFMEWEELGLRLLAMVIFACGVIASYMLTNYTNLHMRKLAKVSMRYAPKRILIGEVRDAAALELLKLWNTGHPGGVGTFHADSAEEALPRLEELVEEAGLGSKQKLIGRGVDVIVFMEKTPDNRRRLSQIIKVHGFNPKTEQYETSNVYTVSAA